MCVLACICVRKIGREIETEKNCVYMCLCVCEREGERERREVRDQRTNSLVAGPMRRKRFLSYRR